MLPTDDQKKLIARVAQEMKTQNNRMTAEPVWLVEQMRRIYGMDADYTDNYVWSCKEDSEYSYEPDEIQAKIIEDHWCGAAENQWHGCTQEKLWGSDPCEICAEGFPASDVDPEEYGYEQIGYHEYYEYVCVHFTESAAQLYVDQNSHRLNKPRVFVHSQYRCWEWNAVVQAIRETSWV